MVSKAETLKQFEWEDFAFVGSEDGTRLVPPARRLVQLNFTQCAKDVPAARLVCIESNPGPPKSHPVPASAPSTIQHLPLRPTSSNDDESDLYSASSSVATPPPTPSLHPLDPQVSTLDTLFDASTHFSIFSPAGAGLATDSSPQPSLLNIPLLLTDVVESPGSNAGASDLSATAGDSTGGVEKLPDGRIWQRTTLVPPTLAFGLPSWFVLGIHLSMTQMFLSFISLSENAARRQSQQFFNGGIDCDGLRTPQCADGAILQQSVESVASLIGVLVTFLVTPIAGALVDVWGRRIMLLVTAVQTMVYPICLLLRYLTGMSYYVTIVLGVLNSFATPAFYPFISDTVPPSRAPFVNGMVVAFELIPDIMGPQLSPMISENIAFWITSGLTTAGLVWTYFFLPETLPIDKRQPFTWRRCNPLVGFRVLTRYVFMTKMALLVFLVSFVKNSSGAILTVTLGVRVPCTAQLQANMQTSAACVVLFSALVILPIVSRYATSRQLLLVVICVTGIGVSGLTLLSLSGTLVIVWASIADLGVLFDIISHILLLKHVNTTEQGALTGAITSLSLLATSLADLFVSPLSLYWSSSGAPFHMYWFPGVLLICILGCAFLLTYRMSEPSEAERLLAKRLDRHRILIDEGATDEHLQTDIQHLLHTSPTDEVESRL